MAWSTAAASKGTNQFRPSWSRLSWPGPFPPDTAHTPHSSPAQGCAQKAIQWATVLSLSLHLRSPLQHLEGEGKGKARSGS